MVVVLAVGVIALRGNCPTGVMVPRIEGLLGIYSGGYKWMGSCPSGYLSPWVIVGGASCPQGRLSRSSCTRGSCPETG